MCTDDQHPAPPILQVSRETPWPGEVIPLEPVDSIAVTVVCDNTVDVFLLDEGPAHRLLGRERMAHTIAAPTLREGKVVDSPLAQHGFSAYVTVTKGGSTHRLLFDTGITPDGCVENMARLDLRPDELEAVVCSHGHFDHTTGLAGLASRLGRTGMPVLIHPEFWTRRRVNLPGNVLELPTTSRRALEETGFSVIEQRRPSFLLDGALLITGEVDRTTEFETGFAVHEALRDGTWEPDPLILDDQALIANVAGKGLVVLTGCGHAGIVNICRYARRLTGIDEIHAVIGGFHLTGPLFEPIIPPTCDALAELAPGILVPAHCTGWRATHALARRFPDAYLQSSVGTTFDLRAS